MPNFVQTIGDQRLLRLADKLEALPLNGNKFDMEMWGYKDECGTTACAAGWGMILMPDLAEAARVIWSRNAIAFDSVGLCRFFSLNSREYNHLFLSFSGSGELARWRSVERIRKFVASRVAIRVDERARADQPFWRRWAALARVGTA